jgi:hypothetical protein
MSRRQDLIEAVILVQKHLETPTDIVTHGLSCKMRTNGADGFAYIWSPSVLPSRGSTFFRRFGASVGQVGSLKWPVILYARREERHTAKSDGRGEYQLAKQ